MSTPTIIYTLTDEAPALATASLLPIIKAFTSQAGITIETRDISLAGRILAQFPERLTPDQKVEDHLAQLGKLVKTPRANIIKLPNISASVPQLKAAVKELQSQGYDLPPYPETPATPEETQIKEKYARVLGSAVNPVLREGNSDRRVADAVKTYARQNPHQMGQWSKDCPSHVAHMAAGDFYGNEKSFTMDAPGTVDIVLETKAGDSVLLKKGLALEKGEIIDATLMQVKALNAFLAREIQDAKEKDLLLSLHLKATMMKVSDPYMFGQAVGVYFADLFDKHQALFDEIGVNPANGLGDVLARTVELDPEVRKEIEADIQAVYAKQPGLAMVDSAKGITNLHVPSDVIVDASMPACIRNGGKMWDTEGNLKETKALIPDRCYARIYARVMADCKQNGAFEVATMGNVSNVGLMAKKAEEYGSHDKTFILEHSGVVKVVDESGDLIFDHAVEKGDIWRMCQTKDAPVQDWVGLGVKRARATGNPAIFWLDANRAHDSQVLAKVNHYLKDHDTNGLDIRILDPQAAMDLTLKRIRAGQDTISVTGNVLRDYLTDLFPIMELGTSAKMLSIVPLLAGGGLFETGAGGTAPMLVKRFLDLNHFSWDSLGECLALAVSLQELGEKTDNPKARILSRTLDAANTRSLMEDRSPCMVNQRKDTRTSHFYLALFWAQALADQDADKELQSIFEGVAKELQFNEAAIIDQLCRINRPVAVLEGYYHPTHQSVTEAMRPSAIFNTIVDGLAED